jgi:hypothetical protein
MLLGLLLLLAQPAQEANPQAAIPSTQAAVPLFANPAGLEALGDLKPTPGAWAEYLVRSRKGRAVRVRISVLPEPAPKDRYWLELDTAAPSAPPQAARLLVHGSPTRAQDIERMELYMLGQAPIEVPIDQGKDALPEPRKSRPPRVVFGGEERVKVRAGAFAARIIDVGGTRVWRSAQVPLWGLVKGRSPRETIELLGSGFEGAHSVFPKPGEK